MITTTNTYVYTMSVVCLHTIMLISNWVSYPIKARINISLNAAAWVQNDQPRLPLLRA